MSHVDTGEELVALLRGELDRARTGDVVGHLRECDDCRSALVEVASVHCALSAAARLLRSEPEAHLTPVGPSSVLAGQSTVELPPLVPVTTRRRLPMVLVACAAGVLLVVGLAAGIQHWRGNASATPSRSVALQAVTGTASGRVSMAEPATQRGTTRMSITTTGLDPAGPGRFYYAWLFDPMTSKMLPLGVVSPDGSTRFDVSDDLVSSYHAVDISLQDDNGDPAHSATSVLHAGY
ncbi:anti-sigma factor domain-containing protein [Angustibacter sp. McL0619]|uniref:anti-sigma factor n=1 Tax=Angustibacter sp. McL0619 TaxID=3415676 RepID=UPI003CF7458C